MIRRTRVIAIILALLVGGSSCCVQTATVSIEEVESGIVSVVNEARATRGLSGLQNSAYLAGIAKGYSESQFSEAARESSDFCYLLSNAWEVPCGQAGPHFDEDTARRQVNYCLGELSLQQAMLRPEARATGVGIAVVENTVYYTQVFDVLYTSGGDGEPIELYEASSSEDPSWDELRGFLEQDDTDQQVYEPGSFVCGDFAEMLHNNAEQVGIRAAYVIIEFPEGPGHALNAFSVEGEIVFIDVVGSQSQDSGGSADKVAYIEVGKTYGIISLAVAEGFSYAYFQQYAERVSTYFEELLAYNEECEAYEEEVGAYNSAVEEYEENPTPAEYDRLVEWQESLDLWHDRLEDWQNILNNERNELGMDQGWWDPDEALEGVTDSTITRVYVHW